MNPKDEKAAAEFRQLVKLARTRLTLADVRGTLYLELFPVLAAIALQPQAAALALDMDAHSESRKRRAYAALDTLLRECAEVQEVPPKLAAALRPTLADIAGVRGAGG